MGISKFLPRNMKMKIKSAIYAIGLLALGAAADAEFPKVLAVHERPVMHLIYNRPPDERIFEFTLFLDGDACRDILPLDWLNAVDKFPVPAARVRKALNECWARFSPRA
jgi:hypothetical protein